MTNMEWIKATEEAVQNECSMIAKVILHLLEVQKRKAYRDAGYSGLFPFMVNRLKYSESSAQRRLQVVRLCMAVPEVVEKIKEGEVNLVAAAKLQAAITRHEKKSGPVSREQKRELFSKIQNKTNKEADQIILEALPGARTKVKESMQRVDHETSKLVAEIPNELRAQLERVKELEKTSSWTETLAACAKIYLRHKDPVEKAKHARRTATVAGERHQIWKRDQGRCTWTNANGERCNSTFAVEVDHVLSKQKGGPDKAHNFQLLCHEHNIFKAELEFGRKFMARFQRATRD